jgi:hypothetical protein
MLTIIPDIYTMNSVYESGNLQMWVCVTDYNMYV